MFLLFLSILSFKIVLSSSPKDIRTLIDTAFWFCIRFERIGIFMMSSPLAETQSAFPFCPVSESWGFVFLWLLWVWMACWCLPLSLDFWFCFLYTWLRLEPWVCFLKTLKQYCVYSWLPGWPFQTRLLIYSADVCWVLVMSVLCFTLKRRWWTWLMQCLLPDEARVHSG